MTVVRNSIGHKHYLSCGGAGVDFGDVENISGGCPYFALRARCFVDALHTCRMSRSAHPPAQLEAVSQQ